MCQYLKGKLLEITMANLQYIKGLRTRALNALKKELENGSHILDTEISNCDKLKVADDISKSIKKLESCSEKLQCQSDKVAETLGDGDPELTEAILNEDATLLDKAMDIIADLQLLKEKLNTVESTKDVTMDETVMQRLFEHQMKLQEEFFKKQSESRKVTNTTNVKLPKLEIRSFNGEKIRWIEFWDSFESAVHTNENISEIDKFNYLKSKLVGEAESAVAGLTLSKENYSVAVKILHERFGNRQEAIDLHYNMLMDIRPPRNTNEDLRIFVDKIEKNIRSLEVLNQNGNQDVFVAIIKKKLPPDVLLQLEFLKGADNKWSVPKLRELLRQYITARENTEQSLQDGKEGGASKMYRENQRDTVYSRNDRYPRKMEYSQTSYKTAQALAAAPILEMKCRFCSRAHWSDECQKYKTIEERKTCLQKSCFKCLREGHMSHECRNMNITCAHCGAKNHHHRSLCPQKFPQRNRKIKENVMISEHINESETDGCVEDESVLLASGEMVVMQTAKSTIANPKNKMEKEVQILLDSGSQRTYLTEHKAKELGLRYEGEQEIKVVTFGSSQTKVLKTKIAKLKLKLKDGSDMLITANIVPTITGTTTKMPLAIYKKDAFKSLSRHLKLADQVPVKAEAGTIDLLIGNDFYLDIIQSERIQIEDGLYLLSSKLGWILTGRTDVNGEIDDMSMLILTPGRTLNDSCLFSEVDRSLPNKPDIEDFWNMEAIGITDSDSLSRDETAMKHFQENIMFEDGRYNVTWPWKNEIPELPENRGLAIGRLKSLTNKLLQKPELMEKYDSIFKDQEQKRIIERVDRDHSDGRKHYLPHHVVITPEKTTSKLRVVYDASAKTKKDGKSLNDCLCRGPVLLKDLCGMMLRFRLHKIGIIADIEKAFHQVGLQTSDRDVTRFLWFKDWKNPVVDENHLQEYRFCRVPFGVISSPFLLSATVEHHLERYEQTSQAK